MCIFSFKVSTLDFHKISIIYLLPFVSYLCKKMTAKPFLRKYSADVAPRVPIEKLSTYRTVFSSRGTVVPPKQRGEVNGRSNNINCVMSSLKICRKWKGSEKKNNYLFR